MRKFAKRYLKKSQKKIENSLENLKKKNTGENQENGIYQFRPEKRTRLRTL